MNSPTRDLPQAPVDSDAAIEPQQVPEPPRLVEMGKVSETHGGWVGYKLDNGNGFQYY